MKLVVEPEAEAEIDRTVDWYARQMPDRRRPLLIALDAAMDQIRERPLLWPTVEGVSLASSFELHRYVMQDFRFLLPYLVGPDAVHVIAFAHTSRNARFWKARARRLSRQH